MGIRAKLWLDNLIKRIELPTSCITLSKHEEFYGLLKNVKVSSSYSTNISRLISLPDLKVAPNMKSYDYHVLLTQMIVVGIRYILLVNVREAIMIFFLFVQCNWSKSTKWRRSRVSGKKALWNFMLSRDIFSTCFFDINVHFTTHLIKEIKLFGSMFLH
jgi:hypothetical protein